MISCYDAGWRWNLSTATPPPSGGLRLLPPLALPSEDVPLVDLRHRPRPLPVAVALDVQVTAEANADRDREVVAGERVRVAPVERRGAGVSLVATHRRSLNRVEHVVAGLCRGGSGADDANPHRQAESRHEDDQSSADASAEAVLDHVHFHTPWRVLNLNLGG